MKKIILSLAVVLLVGSSTALFAQNQNGGQMQQMMKAYLKDSVQLSDAIVDSVMAVRMEFMPQMRTVFMDQSLNATDRQSKMDDIRTRLEGRYKAVGLTDQQMKMIEDRDTRLRSQWQNRPPGGSPNN